MIMRYKRPDYKSALSLLEASERRMKYILSLPVSEDGADTIVSGIYESFRMLGDSLLVSRGIDAKAHPEQMHELLKLKIQTPRPLQLLENMRQLRHNINYYGYKPSLAETKDFKDYAEKCFKPILDEVKKEVKKTNS